MPFTIRKLPNSNKYRVTNKKTGVVHSKATTKKKAEAQVRLMLAIDNKLDTNYLIANTRATYKWFLLLLDKRETLLLMMKPLKTNGIGVGRFV